MLSVPHLVVIFLVALVVFGPEKLPELARTLGRWMADFRKASGDFRSALEDEMRDLERQTREAKSKTEAAALPATTVSSSAEPDPSGEPGVEPEAVPQGTAPVTAPPSEPTASQEDASAKQVSESHELDHAAHDDHHPA